MTEKRDDLYLPSREFVEQAHIQSRAEYERMWKQSIEDPDTFWGYIAKDFHWFKPWTQVYRGEPEIGDNEWFVGGKTNICYNCLDAQIEKGRGDKVALLFQGEPEADCKRFTYNELLKHVCRFANALKKNGVNAEIHVITGSVEVSPGIGLADAIFDIVSSGSTLVSNRLKEVEVVMKSEALLIGNKNMTDEKKAVLEELLFRMDAVKTAEDKKYVLMNAPKDKLEEIIAVLPGMKSPTVMPLAQEGWCSVHTVLDEKRFWEIIGKLKGLGAEGILVLPIEKMIV